jgi:hypothetical protein
VDGLGGSDRDVIVMRFYQRLSYREIGEALGKTAQAAQKQGERALERISSALRKKGAVVPGTVLAAGLAANVKAAGEPLLAALVTQITKNAVTSTATTTTLTQTLLNTLMQINVRTVAVTAAIAAIPLAWKWRESSLLAQEVSELRGKAGSGSSSASSPSAASRIKGNTNGRGTATSATAAAASSQSAGGAAAWEQALLEGDPIERQRKISELISKLTPESAPAVFATFNSLQQKGFPFDSEKMLFLRAWGRLDGQAVMTALKGNADMPPGDSFACAALAGWAANDAAAAKGYIEALSDPQRKAELTYGLLDGWASSDFAAAAAYAASSPRSSERDRFRELLLARAFATGGVEGAQKFFASIPADEHNQLYRQRAFEDVTRLMMMRDPAMAREWLASQDQSLLSANVLAQAGRTDAGGTLNWMNSLTGVDAKTATKAATDILSSWAQTDPTAASAWMNTQKNRPDHDALVSSMSKSLGYTDAEGAMKWAQTISDADQRQQAMASIIRKTFRRNPEGAAAELANLGISQTDIDQAHANQPQMSFVDSVVRETMTGGSGSSGFSTGYSVGGGGGTGAILAQPPTAVRVSGPAPTAGGGSIGIAPPVPSPSSASFELFRAMDRGIE